MQWMPLYCGDILASCADMSPSQFGTYMRLLCYSWQQGGLPNDMEACCRIAGGCTPADWQAVRRRLVVLDEGTSEERLSHPRLESERAKASQVHSRRCEGLAKARAARANTDDRPVNSTDDSTDNSTDDRPVNYPVIRTQPQPQPQPQPQLQVLRNDTPNGVSTSDSVKRRRTYRIHWDCERGFVGITEADSLRWAKAYPGVTLTAEIAKAHAYLCDNPAKSGKRNWAAFLNRWFARVQDRGGTQGPAPPRATYRADAGRDMTASEYRAWQQAKVRSEFLSAKRRKRSGLTHLGELIDESARSPD
jgi:uncharacterized protein YdaU (DUF1376 family)